MFYDAVCKHPRHFKQTSSTAWQAAATVAAVHRAVSPECAQSVEVLAICPNCGQYRRNGDCLNECAKKGLAPVAGPETLNL